MPRYTGTEMCPVVIENRLAKIRIIQRQFDFRLQYPLFRLPRVN